MSAKADLGEIYLAERGVSTAMAQGRGIVIDRTPTSDRFQQRLGFGALSEGKLTDLGKRTSHFVNSYWGGKHD